MAIVAAIPATPSGNMVLHTTPGHAMDDPNQAIVTASP
jgi:hypothetical protein